MSEKADPSFQKARDEALRALVQRGGLTPDQVSSVKLNQVHLATGTLVIEPDEFDPSAAGGPPIRLQLDSAMQRALIAWLVVRPDGPNSHLFPGAGEAGLDVESINQATAAEKPTEKVAAPSPAEREKPETPPESVTSRPPTVAKDEGPVPPPPPVTTTREEPEAVPLDEIETLRQRLAKTYDAWAPAVNAAALRRAAEPPPDVVDSRVPSEPVVTPPPVDKPEPGQEEIPAAPAEREPAPGTPPSGPQETMVTEPMREPSEEAPALAPVPPPLDDANQGLWWRLRNKKVSFRLTGFRLAAVGGLALLLVICCVGLGLAGGTMLGSGEGLGLLAGATATETQTPTQTLPPATSTPAPSPTATVINTPTPVPSATATVSSPPTSTPGPTPTPVVIVVTATPTPEPSPSATPVPTEAPEGDVPPEPTATEVPGFKYPAPVLIWPEDGARVPGVINILQWEPVGALEDGEWYATRVVYRQQGELTYAGDRVKVPEWRIPDRLYYAADGPELEYSWYVFVERDSPDGTPIQLSPESETFVFRWE